MILRALVPAVLFAALLPALEAGTRAAPVAQETRILHIKVTVNDPDGRTRAVPRHALLISDNPATNAPRRVVTSLEGTVDVRLRPGNYTIESDEPLVFQRRSYEWRQTVDVPAGRDPSLNLTAANAITVETSQTETLAAGESSPSELLMEWQGNVVNLWSPTARGAGFVLDRRGLILTNERVVSTAASVEVQFSATKKVTGHVLARDHEKNVAVIWIDPSVLEALPPARLGYAQDGTSDLKEGQDVFAIDASVLDQKTLLSGRLTRAEARVIASDIRIDNAAAGVPIQAASGEIVAITSIDTRGRREAVKIDEARTVIAAAEKKMAGATPPPATPLPVEPAGTISDAWKETAPKRLPSLDPYKFSTADFDVTLITPALNYVMQHPPERTTGAKKAGGTQDMSDIDASRDALKDFGNWDGYVAEIPQVLFIRATPRMKENFWAMIGRQAASTQGVQLPSFKKMQDSFANMRLYCGATEVIPIHPFRIERRIDASNGVFEGLFVFDPASIGTQCAKVRLVLFSEKEPAKGDERVIDGKMLEQIAKDFAATRL